MTRSSMAGKAVGMADAFVIGCEPAKQLVTMKLSGFWTTDTVARFAPEWHAHAKSVSGPASYLCLCDLSDFQPQSREVTAAFDLLLREEGLAASKVAVIAASTITGMQVRRISGPARTQVFTDHAAALRWLTGVSGP